MAVLPHQPGVKVHVAINGSVMPEYDDEEPEVPNTTTKYIEAISDAHFEVRFAFSYPFQTQHGVHVILYLDGVRVRSRTFKESDLLGFRGRERWHTYRRTHFRENGETYTQDFQFSTLVTGRHALFSSVSFGY